MSIVKFKLEFEVPVEKGVTFTKGEIENFITDAKTTLKKEIMYHSCNEAKIIVLECEVK